MTAVAAMQQLAARQLRAFSTLGLHPVEHPALGVASLSLAEGYIPLLTRFTEEDRDAKGLRVFSEGQQSQPPIHLAALELVRDYRLLLLQGTPGAGKTIFARHLALAASGALLNDARYNAGLLQVLEPRNEQGDSRELAWPELPMTLYADRTELSSLAAEADTLVNRWLQAGEALLLIVDDVQQLDAPALFAQAAIVSARYPRLRILLLGDSDICGDWHLPADWQRHSLLPLLSSQRRAWLAGFASAQQASLAHCLTPWAGHPGAFGLALGLPTASGELDLARQWASRADQVAPSRYLQQLLQAVQFDLLRPAQVAQQLADQPLQARRALALHAEGLAAPTALGEALLQHAQPACVLLAAQLAGRDRQLAGHPALKRALLQLIEQPGAVLRERVEAGRALARLGDPRDLLALCAVPAGELVMGTAAYENASPVHRLAVAAFSIGRYPVSNGIYRQFVEATGHSWRSAQGRLPERSNAPAVDLTWHDAQAFCVWLTARWHVEGRISCQQRVRLPTEPEWEYAARGQQAGDGLCYPWQGPWQADHSNGEEASLNDTCSVGLFPQGRSAWGCEDLCGQVWEWTSTLWGDDMGCPTYAYPWHNDSRQNPQAPDRIRRVLRGGCFSSPSWKACCSYRGSLEANGFWRGNGFRIVVGPAQVTK